MMHWFPMEIWKMFSLMCHDSLMFFWDLGNVHSCVMVHLYSFEMLNMFTHVSWCGAFLVKSGKCSQMWHFALTFLEIWKMFAHVSWCTHFAIWEMFTHVSWCTCFLLRSWTCSLMCYVALDFSWDLKKTRRAQRMTRTRVRMMKMLQRLNMIQMMPMTGMIKMMRMNQWWDTAEDKEETENGMDDDFDDKEKDWSAQIKSPQLITWANGNRYPKRPPRSRMMDSCTIWTPSARINYTANFAPQNGYKAEVTPAGATQLPWLLLRSEKCAHVSWCTDLSWDLTNDIHMCHDALTSIEMWKTFTNLSCRMHWLLLRSDKTSDICHDAPTSLEISRICSQMSHDTHVKLRKAGPRVVRCPMSCVGQKQRCQDDSRQCRD